MDRGNWWATVHGGLKSWTWLNTHTLFSGAQGWGLDARENDECANEGRGLVYEGKSYQPNTGISEEGILRSWSSSCFLKGADETHFLMLPNSAFYMYIHTLDTQDLADQIWPTTCFCKLNLLQHGHAHLFVSVTASVCFIWQNWRKKWAPELERLPSYCLIESCWSLFFIHLYLDRKM